MSNADFGLTGLAVMGQNLVLNVESRGYSVAVHNRTTQTMTDFVASNPGKRLFGCETAEQFVAALARPRKIMIMVKAGKPVDLVIDQLLPLVEKGDLLIDGGNSYYKDTVRRNKYLAEKGINFIGTGVSGGEEGALKGPSIMPGGQKEAYDIVAPIFTKIAAQVENTPCCTYIGADGAGHYVKMVHNGIEYGDMQLICEAYHMMGSLLGMGAADIGKVFAEWNRGPLASYLIEITAEILAKVDEQTGKPMVDVILDKAGQKGTGKWTSQDALDMGTPAPTIAEAVFARCLSAVKDQRAAASKHLKGPKVVRYRGDKDELIAAIHDALYASKICSYAQGFALMADAARENKWSLDFGPIAMIWRGGCIIRAAFLHRIKEAYDREPTLANLLLDPFFKDVVLSGQDKWRKVVSLAAEKGVPMPGFSSALNYFDGYRTARLPANLLQAQRDYFGAHTYERTDKPAGEWFHTDWTGASQTKVSSGTYNA